MLGNVARCLVVAAGLCGVAHLHAAPYSVSFRGALSNVLNEGQLHTGDAVSGEIFYDTSLEDVDPNPGLGNYPGATAKIWVRDLYFELAGSMITNATAVFSFVSQTPISAPPEVTYFVEIGFYAPVFFGYGEGLPTNDDRFDGLPEVFFNFQSVQNGVTYYDVIGAANVDYWLSPVPEPDSLLLLLGGLMILTCMGTEHVHRLNKFVQ